MTRVQTCSAGLLRVLRAAFRNNASLSSNDRSRRALSVACQAGGRPRRVQSSACAGREAVQARTFLRDRLKNLEQTRAFSSNPNRCYKSVQEARSRARAGPFSWRSALLFIITGAGMILYFREEKARLERKRIAEQTKGIGRPKVGGPFNLIDQEGRPFTQDDMKGKYALIYFGFTHCPDICPEELDKMAAMYDYVVQQCGNTIRPIFISCDPARDTPAVVKTYLKEFHHDFIGLTGTYDNVKDTCKAYRVYFSTPPHLKPGQDYLVDHSIYFYLMDPEGDFVEALGRTHTPEDAAKIIIGHVKDWTGRMER